MPISSAFTSHDSKFKTVFYSGIHNGYNSFVFKDFAFVFSRSELSSGKFVLCSVSTILQ